MAYLLEALAQTDLLELAGLPEVHLLQETWQAESTLCTGSPHSRGAMSGSEDTMPKGP